MNIILFTDRYTENFFLLDSVFPWTIFLIKAHLGTPNLAHLQTFFD